MTGRCAPSALLPLGQPPPQCWQTGTGGGSWPDRRRTGAPRCGAPFLNPSADRRSAYGQSCQLPLGGNRAIQLRSECPQRPSSSPPAVRFPIGPEEIATRAPISLKFRGELQWRPCPTTKGLEHAASVSKRRREALLRHRPRATRMPSRPALESLARQRSIQRNKTRACHPRENTLTCSNVEITFLQKAMLCSLAESKIQVHDGTRRQTKGGQYFD